MTSFPAGIDLKEIGWTWWHKISKQAKGCQKNLCKQFDKETFGSHIWLLKKIVLNRYDLLQNSIPVASGPLANTETNINGWKSIHLDPNEDNAMVFLDQVRRI